MHQNILWDVESRWFLLAFMLFYIFLIFYAQPVLLLESEKKLKYVIY